MTDTDSFYHRAISTWTTSNGIHCMIRKTQCHLCGYAQIPDEPIWDDLKRLPWDTLSELFPIHGGITYINDDGWIGFDTAHAGDYWDPDELEPYYTPEEWPVTKRIMTTRNEALHNLRPIQWTHGRVIQETETLANTIHNTITLRGHSITRV